MSKRLAFDTIHSINLRLSRHQPLVLVLVSVVSTYCILTFRRFWHKSERSLWLRFKSYIFSKIRRLPSVQRRIEKEMKAEVQAIVNSVHECDKERDFIRLVHTKLHE